MWERISAAISKRVALLTGGTDMVRLVDGVGDGLPGVLIDVFAGRWLVQTGDARLPFSAERFMEFGARSVYWKLLDGGQGAGATHLAGEELLGPFEGSENGTRYWIDFAAGYSQGIFLDQRDNRAWLRERAAGGIVLNTFAYTCAFGLSAAMGGAETLNVDLSRKYLDWGKRNYQLNGLDPAGHAFVKADVFDWLGLLGKQGRKFRAVILDPPTFSRNDKGKVFRVERDFPEFVARAIRLVEKEGWLLCTTNQRSLEPWRFEGLIRDGLDAAGVGRTRGGDGAGLETRGMPQDFCGVGYLKSVIVGGF